MGRSFTGVQPNKFAHCLKDSRMYGNNANKDVVSNSTDSTTKKSTSQIQQQQQHNFKSVNNPRDSDCIISCL